MKITNTVTFSRHAARRCADRGLRPDFLTALLDHADLEADVGGSATALSVSRERAKALNLDDRLGHYAAIVSADAVIISVVPIRSGRRGRPYRKGRR